MPDPVYSTSESGGKSRAVAGVVYENTASFQADMGNHNPRVGGSSPSSATIKTTENCDKSPVTKDGPQDGLHPDCKRNGNCVPWYRQELYARWGKFAPCQCDRIKDHLVYFIQAGEGDIKIGTTTNLPKRLAALQSAHPRELKVLATVEGAHSLEAEYHARFMEYRLRGEWFTCSPEILREIRKLNRAPRLPMHTPLPGKQEIE